MPGEAGATGVHEAALRDWIERVLAAGDPADTLLRGLEALDAQQDLATQAALFESVFWRAETRHYWVYYRMSRVYAELGRADAGLLLAGLAVALQPDWAASATPYRDLFRGFVRRGMTEIALDVFARQAEHNPERPVAEPHEVEALLRTVGRATVDAIGGGPDPDAPARAGAARRRDHRVIEADSRPATPIRAGGTAPPTGLVPLGRAMERPAIDVAELPDGELLISRNAVVVRDAAGGVQADLSVCAYPSLVARRFRAVGAAAEEHEVAEAVLILDGFPAPNLGHFLLDQVNRIELYRRAGADLGRALVVGPSLRTAYQLEIVARAGASAVLDTDRLARVRARRLWVSSDCRDLRHPAHHGAPWAIEHARAVLGGRGVVGRRRLLVSRADSRTRQLVGEAALGEALARFGFETIVPGAMPYREQLECFRTASHVVAVHGAALAHLVICPPGTRVLEMFHPLYGTWAYAMTALACGLDYEALVGRDGASDAPELNDPARAAPEPGGFGERHIRVTPDMLDAWLERVG